MAIMMMTNQADAAESYKGKAIGIIIEKSCLISDRCLDYKDIVHLDTTDPKYMGGFVEKDNDIVRKVNSNHNNYKWLAFQSGYVIIVDPPLRSHTQIPIISIVSKLDEFHTNGQYQASEYKPVPDSKATHKIIRYSHTRYVDSTCTNAIITAKDWQTVLPDTISYLKSGCDPNETKLKTVSTKSKELVKHDIKTSYKWKIEKKIDQIKKECLKARNSCSLSVSDLG